MVVVVCVEINLLARGTAEITFVLLNFLYLRVLIAASKRLKLLVTKGGSKKHYLSYGQGREGQEFFSCLADPLLVMQTAHCS